MTERNNAESLLNGKKAWTMAIIVFLCFFIVETGEQRVPPILPILYDEMGLSILQGGTLQSILGWGSLISALPAAWILLKCKPKLTMGIAVIMPALSGVIGALWPTYAGLCISSCISGLAIGILGVICAAIIDEWFTPEKRGLPNGILLGTYPLSVLFMLNVSPVLCEKFDFPAVWWVGAVIAAVGIVIVFAGLSNRAPYTEYHGAENAEEASEKVSIGTVLKNKNLWMVLLGFGFFDIAFYGLNTYSPSILVDNLGANLDVANLVTSVMFIALVPANVITGALLNKTSVEKRKVIPIIGLIGLGVGVMLAFVTHSLTMAIIALLVAGLAAGMCPSSFFTIGPDCIKNPAYIGIIVALVTFFQNLGIAIGPLVAGTIVEAAGNNWAAAGIPMMLISFAGAVACFFIKNKSER